MLFHVSMVLLVSPFLLVISPFLLLAWATNRVEKNSKVNKEDV